MNWEEKNPGTDRTYDQLQLGQGLRIAVAYPYQGHITAPVAYLYEQDDVLVKKEYTAESREDARLKAMQIILSAMNSRAAKALNRMEAVKDAVEQLYPETQVLPQQTPAQTRLLKTINQIVKGKILGDIMNIAPGIGEPGLPSCAVLVKNETNITEARYGGKTLSEILAKIPDLRYAVIKSYSERGATQVWYVEFH